jgi:hypothetical protein
MTNVRHSSSRTHSHAPDPPTPALPPPQPFKPHRGLFVLISVMLFAWLLVLLVLYFTTVYPYKHTRVEYPGENLPAAPTP